MWKQTELDVINASYIDVVDMTVDHRQSSLVMTSWLAFPTECHRVVTPQ